MWEEGGVQMERGGLWVPVYSSGWCEKGVMRRLCKDTLRIGGEIKERACMHSFWVAKPMGSLVITVINKPSKERSNVGKHTNQIRANVNPNLRMTSYRPIGYIYIYIYIQNTASQAIYQFFSRSSL